jgi:ABC-type Mn2+/Zn2+ transport system permease subunit
MDPPMAEACGIRVARWNLALGVAAGLAIGLSLGSAGMLYTFGLLVLPGLAARSLAREVRTLFALAPAIALAGAVAGFVLAHEYDFPPAQMTVALLAALQLPAWAIRRTRAR